MAATIPIMIEDSSTFLEDFWMIAVCAESLYTPNPLLAVTPTSIVVEFMKGGTGVKLAEPS